MTSYIKGTGSAVSHKSPILINNSQNRLTAVQEATQSKFNSSTHQLSRKSWMLMSENSSQLLWLELIWKVHLEKVQPWNDCSAACWLPGSGTGHEKGSCGNSGVLSADGFGRASCPWKSVVVSSIQHTFTSCKVQVRSYCQTPSTDWWPLRSMMIFSGTFALNIFVTPYARRLWFVTSLPSSPCNAMVFTIAPKLIHPSGINMNHGALGSSGVIVLGLR